MMALKELTVRGEIRTPGKRQTVLIVAAYVDNSFVLLFYVTVRAVEFLVGILQSADFTRSNIDTAWLDRCCD
jgi:hypothetical protein